ncbi:MAG TPA: zinc-binding alcohol dehydrogenase family protein [Tepidisphaeraceae bacterium]|nr:zinc-binding alcohol dehydrogenase family protein [Tepidisphaeraceae bacterium]
MKAWLLDQFNGISNIRLAEVPDPAPGPGQVAMAVRFAGLNPADRYLAEGQYPARPPLPHILGRDAVGTIVALGPGVYGLNVGDRRCILRGEVGVSRAGTFAQRVVVPVESLVEIPAGWDEPQAAGATLVYLTAYQALTQWGELPPSVVLITGASGGVGVASTQLAKAMAHIVVGLSRSAEKQRRLRELGAAITLDPHDKTWPAQLKQALNGRRVDLAIDNIGGELFNRVIDTLGDHGRISVVGRLAGPVPQFNTASLFFRRLRIGGVAVGAYTNQESRSAWNQVVQLLASSGAKPLVDHVFPFDELPQAFKRLDEGPMGKVLLRAHQ